MNHTEDRDKAILWARDLLTRDFVILDTETTGLGSTAEAVSIGIVSRSGHVLVDSLIRHVNESEPGALRTHGHSWEETRQAPPWVDLMPLITETIVDRPIVTYCVDNFDARIVLQTCRAHGVPDLDISRRTIEALEPISAFVGDWNNYHGNYRWQSLTNAAGYLGVEVDGAHNAAADALTTLRVVEAVANSRLSSEDR